jgi:hypothetical protein
MPEEPKAMELRILYVCPLKAKELRGLSVMMLLRAKE